MNVDLILGNSPCPKRNESKTDCARSVIVPPAMNEEMPRDQWAAWKAQQEANRQARLLQLHGREGVWKRQQTDLADLARLRPNAERHRAPMAPEK